MYRDRGEIPKNSQITNVQRYKCATFNEERIQMGSFLCVPSLPLVLILRFSLEQPILPSYHSVIVPSFRPLQSNFYGTGWVLKNALQINIHRQVTVLISDHFLCV